MGIEAQTPESTPGAATQSTGIGDDELLERFLKLRHNDDFESLVERFQNYVYRIALCTCSNAALAEEATQEIFVQLGDSSKSWTFTRNGPQASRGWLFHFTRNVVLDYVKRERRTTARTRSERFREQSMRLQESRAQAAMNNDPQREMVSNALGRLAEDLRLPLTLYFIEDVPQGDIGRLLGLGQSQVSRRIAKGLELLKKDLAAQGMVATSLLLPSLLKDPSIFAAPDSLQATLRDLVRNQPLVSTAGSEASRRLPAYLASKSIGTITAICAAVVLSTGGVLWWYASAPFATSPTIQNNPIPSEETEQPKLYRKWNFNKPPPDVDAPNSKWRWIENGGPDGSGCLEAVIIPVTSVLGTSIKKFPAMLSFKYKPVSNTPVLGGFGFGWQGQENAALLTNISPVNMLPASDPPWLTERVYITPDYLVAEAGQLRQITITHWKPNLYFGMTMLGGRFRIDDIILTEIPQNQVPDISRYLEAYEKIPKERRHGSVELPGIESPRPGMKAMVQFTGTSAP